jgi:hypothetical protein
VYAERGDRETQRKRQAEKKTEFLCFFIDVLEHLEMYMWKWLYKYFWEK